MNRDRMLDKINDIWANEISKPCCMKFAWGGSMYLVQIFSFRRFDFHWKSGAWGWIESGLGIHVICSSSKGGSHHLKLLRMVLCNVREDLEDWLWTLKLQGFTGLHAVMHGRFFYIQVIYLSISRKRLGKDLLPKIMPCHKYTSLFQMKEMNCRNSFGFSFRAEKDRPLKSKTSFIFCPVSFSAGMLVICSKLALTYKTSPSLKSVSAEQRRIGLSKYEPFLPITANRRLVCSFLEKLFWIYLNDMCGIGVKWTIWIWHCDQFLQIMWHKLSLYSCSLKFVQLGFKCPYHIWSTNGRDQSWWKGQKHSMKILTTHYFYSSILVLYKSVGLQSLLRRWNKDSFFCMLCFQNLMIVMVLMLQTIRLGKRSLSPCRNHTLTQTIC